MGLSWWGGLDVHTCAKVGSHTHTVCGACWRHSSQSRGAVAGAYMENHAVPPWVIMHAWHMPPLPWNTLSDLLPVLFWPPCLRTHICAVLICMQLLIEEIRRGGVVDSTHQPLLLTLCALAPKEVHQVGGRLVGWAGGCIRIWHILAVAVPSTDTWFEPM